MFTMFRVVEQDLRTLSVEARKRFPEVKDAAERNLLSAHCDLLSTEVRMSMPMSMRFCVGCRASALLAREAGLVHLQGGRFRPSPRSEASVRFQRGRFRGSS